VRLASCCAAAAVVLSTVVAAAQTAPRPAAHLTAATRVAEPRAAAGKPFSVLLDVTPAPRIHVYAPAVTGYKPIKLAISPQAGLVVGDVKYPAAEDYYYAPLNEHVQVFQKAFTIAQALSLDPSPAGRAALKDASRLTIAGTLSYQACDDKICYPPRTMPLTWNVDLAK
jgi:hypothetical protein